MSNYDCEYHSVMDDMGHCYCGWAKTEFQEDLNPICEYMDNCPYNLEREEREQ